MKYLILECPECGAYKIYYCSEKEKVGRPTRCFHCNIDRYINVGKIKEVNKKCRYVSSGLSVYVRNHQPMFEIVYSSDSFKEVVDEFERLSYLGGLIC